MTETKIPILYDHVEHTRFQIVEMGRQMVKPLSADVVGPTSFVNLTPALEVRGPGFNPRSQTSRVNELLPNFHRQ